MIKLPNLESANVNEKRVFLRCDFDVLLTKEVSKVSNVPRVSEGKQAQTPFDTSDTPDTSGTFRVADDSRLVSTVSTIEYLLENGATVIAVGHLGRPSKQFSIFNFQFSNSEPQFSLLPVAEWFAKEFSGSSLLETSIQGFPAWQLRHNFYILENLRFFNGEESNDSVFAEKLSDLADIYVNEAFGVSHRAHASIVGVPKILPHFAGFHLAKEVRVLDSILDHPKRPLTIIIGGAKMETKLPLIAKMHGFADYVLVGGKIAEETKTLIKEQHEKIASRKALLLVADHNSSKTDISEISLENFLQVVHRSKCVIWNGPLGRIQNSPQFGGQAEFRIPPNSAGRQNSELDEGDEGYTSLRLAKAIIGTSAYKVVGGGDTIAFLNKHNLLEKFDFVSTGGGAMLAFLSGQTLPGLLALHP